MEQTAPAPQQTSLRKAAASPFAAPLTAAVLTLVFFAVGYQFFGIRYEVNDDANLANIANGAYGPNSQYLIHVSVLIGWALKGLYLLLPGHNWLVITWLCAGLCLYATLGTLMMRRIGLLWGAGFYAALLLCAGPDFFFKFHYSKYAAVFLVTGLVLVALNLGRWNAPTITGMVLVVLGSMIRIEQLFPIGGMSAGILLYRFFKLDAKGKTRAALAVGLMLAVCFGVRAVDWAAYQTNSEWKAYREYNDVRTEISDYRLQFAEDPASLIPYGYSENDYYMIKRWVFYDPEVFSPEALAPMAEALPQSPLGKTLVYAAKNLVWSFMGNPLRMLLSAMVLAWLVLSGKKQWPAMAGTFGMFVLMVAYLSWRGRYPDRIAHSFVFAALCFCATCFEWPRPPERKTTALFAGLLLVACLPYLNVAHAEAEDYWRSSRMSRAADVRPLMADPDNLYIMDTELFDAACGYDVWNPRPPGSMQNIVFVGSWMAASPFIEDTLARHGIESVYRDAIDRPDVFFADSENISFMQTFVREHYDPRAEMVMVSESLSFRVYSLVSSTAPEERSPGT